MYDFFGKDIKVWFLGGYNLFFVGLNLLNFFGCMKDFSIDGLYVLFLGLNKFVMILFWGGVVDEGCDGSGLCVLVCCIDLDKFYCFEEWELVICISDK